MNHPLDKFEDDEIKQLSILAQCQRDRDLLEALTEQELQRRQLKSKPLFNVQQWRLLLSLVDKELGQTTQQRWIPFDLAKYRHDGSEMLFLTKGEGLVVARVVWDAETPAYLDDEGTGYTLDDITHYMDPRPLPMEATEGQEDKLFAAAKALQDEWHKQRALGSHTGGVTDVEDAVAFTDWIALVKVVLAATRG